MKLRKRILLSVAMQPVNMLLIFISTTTAPISSNPLWIPHNAPSVQQSRCLIIAPIMLPHISDSARLPSSNQVSAEVLKRTLNLSLNKRKYLPPSPTEYPQAEPLTPPLVLKHTVSLETQSISGLLIDVLTSLLHLYCIDSWFNVSDVIKCGGTPFMGLQVREKSTSNNATS